MTAGRYHSNLTKALKMATTYDKCKVELDSSINETPVVYLVQWQRGAAHKSPQIFKSVAEAFIAGRDYGTNWLRENGAGWFRTISEDGETRKLRELCEREVNSFESSVFIFEDSAGDEVGRFIITEQEIQ